MTLPWFGFILGWIASKIFSQPYENAIAIAIEVGWQNTGLTMFLMTFSLDQPAADLAMVVPIAVSIMSPITLFAMILVRKFLQ